MMEMNGKRFEWMDESLCTVKEEVLEIKATASSDYFVNPATGEKSLNAPFLYTTIHGDFTLRANVSPTFNEVYDACGFLFYDHELLWGKLCFEYTDIGENAVVSVITNGTSDDANGQAIEEDNVWLQLSRKGQLFSMHYSLDGQEYRMVRYFSLPCREELKVGFSAQSPLGQSGRGVFREIILEDRCLTDMRRGK